MATKSEDIRLQINNVRFKKGDGTLYLMAERLGWMPNTKDNFTISHKYSDIKMQKISPEGKSKIQLQLVLHTGENTTFQFDNLDDRTAVKDALLQILPQFKGKMPKDREKKALILSKNPNLLQLYKDLVETKIVTADYFWSQFVDESSDPTENQSEQQDVGVSADFLAGIPLNGKQVKGNVSLETLMAILKTYPRVAKKHQELVPTKMSETEFWNKFFQSRYFNRDRTKDLFSDCFKSEEKEWTSAVRKGRVDPFYDLNVIRESYQYTDDDTAPSSSHDNPDRMAIKRLTQQSIRLLESLQENRQADKSQESLAANMSQSTNGDEGDSADSPAGPQISSADRDFTDYALAGVDDSGDYPNEQSRISSRTHQINRDKYSIVPQNQQQLQLSTSMIRDHLEAIKSWNPKLSECMAPKDATEALKNLSPAGYLMRSSNTNRLSDTVPEDLQLKLKSAYYGSNELLRHFWLCFPAVEPTIEAKLVRLHETLQKFESSRLQPLYDSLPRDQRHFLNHLMRVQFKTAHRKYDNWKSKKRQRETVRHRNGAARAINQYP